MRLLFLTLLTIVFLSCSKKQVKTNEPYLGNIAIDSTNTIKTVAVSQNIMSRVRLVQPEVCGDMTLKGFEIVENPAKHFAIRAKALYKNREGLVCLQVYQTYDTAVTITTKVTGIHFLNFYNGTRLFKSDTVHVN